MNHTATLASLHDGHLHGFIVNDDEARIFVKTDSGRALTLILTGVKRFNVDGFAEGNIILDSELSGHPDVPTDLLVALNHGSSDERQLEQVRTLVAEGNYQVFWIVPSYGATTVALTKGLTIVDGTSLPG
jgi:hypothetical protein